MPATLENPVNEVPPSLPNRPEPSLIPGTRRPSNEVEESSSWSTEGESNTILAA